MLGASGPSRLPGASLHPHLQPPPPPAPPPFRLLKDPPSLPFLGPQQSGRLTGEAGRLQGCGDHPALTYGSSRGCTLCRLLPPAPELLPLLESSASVDKPVLLPLMGIDECARADATLFPANFSGLVGLSFLKLSETPPLSTLALSSQLLYSAALGHSSRVTGQQPSMTLSDSRARQETPN